MFSLDLLVVLMGLSLVASPTSDVLHLPAAFVMYHDLQRNSSSNECMPHRLGIFYSSPENEIRSVARSYLADFGLMTGSGHWRGTL